MSQKYKLIEPSYFKSGERRDRLIKSLEEVLKETDHILGAAAFRTETETLDGLISLIEVRQAKCVALSLLNIFKAYDAIRESLILAHNMRREEVPCALIEMLEGQVDKVRASFGEKDRSASAKDLDDLHYLVDIVKFAMKNAEDIENSFATHDDSDEG